MKNNTGGFKQKIESLAKLGKPKIGFGLVEPNKEILRSLRAVADYAFITLVGPNEIANIKDFPVIANKNPEQKLAQMLARDEVEGIVRGTIDDFKTWEAYEKMTAEHSITEPMLFEDHQGNAFFIGPVSNPEGWTKQERLKIILELANFMQDWDLTPNVAVFAAVRHDTYPRRKHIRTGVLAVLNKSYEDAEWLVKELTHRKISVKNWAIDLNPAVESGASIINPINGMVGNQIFRALLLGGCKVLATPRLGLKRFYEEGSRTEKDYSWHVKFLAARINQAKQIQG